MFIIYIVDCIAEQHGLVVKRSSGNQEVGGSYPAALIGGKNKNLNRIPVVDGKKHFYTF